jgi:hypothetical protein
MSDTWLASYPDRPQAEQARNDYARLLVNLGQQRLFGVRLRHLANRAGWTLYLARYERKEAS